MKLTMDFEILDLADEMVAVPVGDNVNSFHGVLKLNEEAAAIIRLLGQETTAEQIADELLKEYNVSREELLGYINSFVDQLRSNNLLAE